MNPRSGLDDVEKRKFLTIRGLELRPHGRPACSQSLTDRAIPANNYLLTYLLTELSPS
jgi:hypothetical protein